MLNFFNFIIRGIDVSKYDLKIVVDKLAGKIHFVICRIGHGTKTDPLFKAFWESLKGKAYRLAYFYLDYYSNHIEGEAVYGIGDYEWGVIQGKNAWDNQKDDNDKGLVYLDIENGNLAYAPEIDTVWDRVETMADGFFDTYDKASGLVNGIYCSLSKLKQFSQRFRHRPLYIAWYNENQTRESVTAAVRAQGWTGEIHFWQYASDGDTGTDGVGDGLDFGLGRKVMDLDVWMGTEDEWKAFTGDQQMADILLNITPLAQKDPRWSSFKLGTSGSTIGGYGCLITSASMMLRHFGFDTDPGRLNDLLKANGGFHDGNLFVWGALEKIFKGVSFGYRYNGAYLDKIDEQLRAGKPVIINVDMYPATAALDEHWVLIVGKVGGSYIINDPWYGTQFKFEDKYGAPGKGVRIVCTYNFAGVVTPPEPETVLYRVKVTIQNLLIRGGAGANYPVVYRYASGEYDVFEERNGYGRIGVGRWIALQYTSKIVTNPQEVTDSEKLSILWNWYKESHD